MAQLTEIQRLIAAGHSNREIARALHCRRVQVAAVREGSLNSSVLLRAKGKLGARVVQETHLPENSQAYREVTPQRLLSQARFVHADLYGLINELFEVNTLGNLRRAQGFIRKAHVVIQSHGQTIADPWIVAAIASMRRFCNIRVKKFEDLIKAEMKKTAPTEDRNITRIPGNPMVRGHGTRAPEETPSVPVKESI